MDTRTQPTISQPPSQNYHDFVRGNIHNGYPYNRYQSAQSDYYSNGMYYNQAQPTQIDNSRTYVSTTPAHNQGNRRFKWTIDGKPNADIVTYQVTCARTVGSYILNRDKIEP